DTLKTKPPENKTMKKASLLVVTVTTFFYMLCSFFGYAAFGENTPGNLLLGFGFYEPYWLVDFANACILVHLVGAYQLQIRIKDYGINTKGYPSPKMHLCMVNGELPHDPSPMTHPPSPSTGKIILLGFQ
ncbi:hypothetical protein KI387_030652, partial [Taxus chinensis]